jgi:hypothetical protein
MHGVIVVYDVTSDATFSSAKRWINQIETSCEEKNVQKILGKWGDPEMARG